MIKFYKMQVLLWLFTALLLGGCQKEYQRAYRFSGNSVSQESDERMILYSADITLLVDEPDSASVYIVGLAKKYQGYVNETGTERTVIRVKAGLLNEAMRDISALGKVEKESRSGEDVTEAYTDFNIRLENAEKARQRYLQLLERAENVAAALLVEKELERLNETIDLLKGQMNRLEHLEEFSTITVKLKERKKPGVLGYIGVGVYKAVKWLFVRN